MQLKDYYTILELPPSASPEEIKKAYRRLAQVYHPDKNGDDRYNAARFTDIKDAYEILTNPTRKALYLQQRWYAKSMGKPMTIHAVTPLSILKKSIELDRYVRTLDIHRMDEEGLSRYMMELFSDEVINKIKEFNDPQVMKEIVQSSIRSLQHLPFPTLTPVIVQLKKIAADDKSLEDQLDDLFAQKRSNHFWQRKRTAFVLLAALLFCLLIFFITRKN